MSNYKYEYTEKGKFKGVKNLSKTLVVIMEQLPNDLESLEGVISRKELKGSKIKFINPNYISDVEVNAVVALVILTILILLTVVEGILKWFILEYDEIAEKETSEKLSEQIYKISSKYVE